MASDTFWARLKHGSKYLRLDEEPFLVAKSFSPPATNKAANFSESGKRVSEKYADKAWAFNVCIYGANEAEVLGYISRLCSFLENARDTQYPLYLEYYPYNAIDTIPLWGQGVYRYTIKDATCQVISPWDVRDEFAVVSINARIDPIVEGQRQRVAYATGGIYEDTIKTPDGLSRGVQVCTAGTNLVTNPIFSHSTWNTGWTMTGTVGLATKITDSNIVPFGEACALIQNIADAGTTRAYFQQEIVTTGTADYVLSAYVKLLDGRAPGTADLQLKGTASLASFNRKECGDGWYRIWDTDYDVSGTTNMGITLMKPGVACYVDGFQMEVPSAMGTVPTPLMHGDALGCSWSGTRGASTSVRTSGVLKIPTSSETLSNAAASVRMAVKWYETPKDTMHFFDSDNAGIEGIKLYSVPGTVYLLANYAESSYTYKAATFSAGDISVLHACWGRTSDGTDQLALYVNGSGTATDSLLLDSLDPYIYLGASYAGSNKAPYTILDFTTFNRLLTSAEVAADYAQVYEHVTGGDGLGQALNRVPYLWTTAGDGTVQSYPSGTGTADYAIAGGIPGDLPARTIFDVKATFAGTADGGLLMANQVYKDILDELNMYSATDVAQDVGTASWVWYPSGGTTICLTRQLDAYRGQKAYFLTSLADAGSTYCKARMVISYDTLTNAYFSNYTALATDGTAAWFLIGPTIIPDTLPSSFDWLNGYGELNAFFQLYRTTGAGTITMSELRFIPGSFMYAPVTGLTTNHALVIDGDKAYSYNSSTSKEDGLATLYGDKIELVPGKYNHLITIPMSIGRDTNMADTITFNRVYVTPRYSLL